MDGRDNGVFICCCDHVFSQSRVASVSVYVHAKPNVELKKLKIQFRVHQLMMPEKDKSTEKDGYKTVTFGVAAMVLTTKVRLFRPPSEL